MDTKRLPPCPASSGEEDKNLWRAAWRPRAPSCRSRMLRSARPEISDAAFCTCNDCTLAFVPAPVCPLPRLNAHSSLDLGPENADFDAVTFTERLMDDAAADIHKLDDEVAAIKAENALLKAENSLAHRAIDEECGITEALLSSLVEECELGGGFAEVGDEYTFYIPLKDNLRFAEKIIERGQPPVRDFYFPQGRFSYTRLDDGPNRTGTDGQYIQVQLEELY